jgi:hypothetical protein
VRRRALLATLATGVGGGLVGCTGTPGSGRQPTTGVDGGETTSRPSRSDPTDAGTEPPIETERAVDTETPTDTDARSPTAGPELGVPIGEAACPPDPSSPWADDVERVVCWPDRRDAPARLVPSTEAASLPRATIEFSLENRTDARLLTNFFNWSVHKLIEGTWHRIEPRAVNVPAMALSPGERHTWRLTVDNTAMDGSVPRNPSGTSDVTVVGLGGGTYGFATDGTFPGDHYTEATAFAARFELSGPPIEVRPTADVTHTVGDCGDLVVHTSRTRREGSRLAAFALTPVAPSAVPARASLDRLLPEQVIRNRQLRNTLAYRDRVEEGESVELVEPTGATPPFGRDGPRFIRFGGTVYRTETWVIEGPGHRDEAGCRTGTARRPEES